MALARCDKHGHPKGQRGNVYLSDPLIPVGYPHSGVICGRTGCENPAKIWVVAAELKSYQNGERIFGFGQPPINFVKVRVEDPA
jgi:hypothetical protein